MIRGDAKFNRCGWKTSYLMLLISTRFKKYNRKLERQFLDSIIDFSNAGVAINKIN